MRLRRDLASREAEVRDLRAQHRDQARILEEFARNATRNTAKLRRQATRADAASGIADAEVAVAQARSMGQLPGEPMIALAEEHLRSAAVAFERGEYGVAYDRAEQAWQIVNAALDERGAATPAGGMRGEVAFARAIPLRVRIESNLRRQPGMAGQVVGRLKETSLVIARASRGQWTRVMTADGRAGWVYSPLLGPR